MDFILLLTWSISAFHAVGFILGDEKGGAMLSEFFDCPHPSKKCEFLWNVWN